MAANARAAGHRGGDERLRDAERAIEVGPRDDFAVLGVVCGVFRPFMEQVDPVEQVQPAAQPTLPVATDESIN